MVSGCSTLVQFQAVHEIRALHQNQLKAALPSFKTHIIVTISWVQSGNHSSRTKVSDNKVQYYLKMNSNLSYLNLYSNISEFLNFLFQNPLQNEQFHIRQTIRTVHCKAVASSISSRPLKPEQRKQQVPWQPGSRRRVQYLRRYFTSSTHCIVGDTRARQNKCLLA